MNKCVYTSDVCCAAGVHACVRYGVVRVGSLVGVRAQAACVGKACMQSCTVCTLQHVSCLCVAYARV